MLEAEICIRYGSSKLASAVTSAILPDNEPMSEKLLISTFLTGSELKIHIQGCTRVETLQTTIHDLFRCMHAAEESFFVTKRRRKL